MTTEHTDTDRLERIGKLVLRLNADEGLSPDALSGLQRLTQAALDASRAQRAAQETPDAPEPPEETWNCSICGRSNYVTVTHCEHCDYSRSVLREGRLVPRNGQR